MEHGHGHALEQRVEQVCRVLQKRYRSVEQQIYNLMNKMRAYQRHIVRGEHQV